jgi:hypothetical protein
MNAAEAFQLPGVRNLARMGVFVPREAAPERVILPSVPIVLPEDSMR